MLESKKVANTFHGSMSSSKSWDINNRIRNIEDDISDLSNNRINNIQDDVTDLSNRSIIV